MKRRDFFKWVGIGAAVAAVPGPIRSFIKDLTPQLILDGLGLEKGDRLLITGATNTANNGIYHVVATGDSKTPWKLHRRGIR